MSNPNIWEKLYGYVYGMFLHVKPSMREAKSVKSSKTTLKSIKSSKTALKPVKISKTAMLAHSTVVLLAISVSRISDE